MKATAIFLAVLLSVVSPVAALAEAAQACRTIKAHEASLLVQCGTQLHSFSLSLLDATKTVGRDLHGRFLFDCPIPEFCSSDPTIGGFFFSPTNWNNSRKDERAIFETLQQAPLARMDGRPPEPMPAACPVFDVLIGSMKAHAVCYSWPETKASAVVIIASDEQFGIVLSFYRDNQGASELREKVMAVLPKFKVERAVGDAALLRWMK